LQSLPPLHGCGPIPWDACRLVLFNNGAGLSSTPAYYDGSNSMTSVAHGAQIAFDYFSSLPFASMRWMDTEQVRRNDRPHPPIDSPNDADGTRSRAAVPGPPRGVRRRSRGRISSHQPPADLAS
jgi:hypothetical protein